MRLQATRSCFCDLYPKTNVGVDMVAPAVAPQDGSGIRPPGQCKLLEIFCKVYLSKSIRSLTVLISSLVNLRTVVLGIDISVSPLKKAYVCAAVITMIYCCSRFGYHSCDVDQTWIGLLFKRTIRCCLSLKCKKL